MSRPLVVGPLPLERTYSFEDHKTLASLKRTYEPPVTIQRLTCGFQHVLLVDEIAAKRISKPGESDSSMKSGGSHQTLPTGSAWMTSGEIAQKYRGQAIETFLAEARSRSLKRQ